jgi:SAM-dependent methyltransferase
MDVSKVAKQIKLLYSANTETATPFELAEDMLSHIDIDWKDPNLKFLDPCCGRGTFLLALLEKLQDYHTIDHIVTNMLYGSDISKIQSAIATKALRKISGLQPNIYNTDSLEKEFDIQFDVVVGSPPFNKPNPVSSDRMQPKNHNLWTEFAYKSFKEFVKPNGWVSFVTPDSWMSPSNDLYKLFKEKQLLRVDLNCARFFKGGSSFTAWTAQNVPYTQETDFGNTSVDLRVFPYLPRNIKDNLSIHKKVLATTLSSINAVRGKAYKIIDVVGDNTCHSSKTFVAREESKEFKYLLQHTNAQVRYSNKKSLYHDNIKVMWTLSGYYKPHIDLGTMGFTEVNQAILCESEDEAKAVYSIMNSKLYHLIVTTAKWSGFLNGKVFLMLPDLGKHKVYTDEEIYKLFDLSEEEIEVCERITVDNGE